MNINWTFKQAYKEHGFTLQELATRTGITRSYLSLFSNGRMNLPNDQIARLALILDVPASQLTNGGSV